MAIDNEVGQSYDGDVYIRRWFNGVLEPEVIGPMTGTKLGIKAQSETKTNLSNRRGMKGKAVDTLTIGKPTAFSIAFNRANSKLLAMVFLGVSALKNIAGGTITAEPITLPHDVFVKVSQRNLSAVTIPTATEGTDFIVDTRLGMIKSLSTGSLADGVVTSFSATFGAIDALRISGGTKSKVEVEVILDGSNEISGKDVYIRVPKVPLIPDAEMDFLSTDFITVGFTGEMITLETEEAEFYVDDNPVLA